MFFWGRKKERRAAPRFEVDKDFKVHFQTMDQVRRLGYGDGKDVSTVGMRFATFAHLKKGQKLDAVVEFVREFPGTKKIPLEMEVVRVYRGKGQKRYRAGVRYLDLAKYESEIQVVREFTEWIQSRHNPA